MMRGYDDFSSSKQREVRATLRAAGCPGVAPEPLLPDDEVPELAQAKSTQTNAAKIAQNAQWLTSHIPGLKYEADAEEKTANSNTEWANELKGLMNHPPSDSLREQLHKMH